MKIYDTIRCSDGMQYERLNRVPLKVYEDVEYPFFNSQGMRWRIGDFIRVDSPWCCGHYPEFVHGVKHDYFRVYCVELVHTADGLKVNFFQGFQHYEPLSNYEPECEIIGE